MGELINNPAVTKDFLDTVTALASEHEWFMTDSNRPIDRYYPNRSQGSEPFQFAKFLFQGVVSKRMRIPAGGISLYLDSLHGAQTLQMSVVRFSYFRIKRNLLEASETAIEILRTGIPIDASDVFVGIYPRTKQPIDVVLDAFPNQRLQSIGERSVIRKVSRDELAGTPGVLWVDNNQLNFKAGIVDFN